MAQSRLYQEDFHPSPLQYTWLEFKKSHISLAGLWCLVFFLLLLVIGPLIAPYDPLLQNTNALLLPPSWEANGTVQYILGTDSLGRDVLSRIIYACRLTFGVSIGLVIISMLIGVFIGALAGISKGVKSSFINHILDAFMAIPTLLIAIILVAILGIGLSNIMLAILLALTPRFIHSTRDMVRKEFQKDYVTAARLDGASKLRILINSILPNMIGMLVVEFTMALSTVILDISALGFLSLGVQAPTPELGAMLSEGLKLAYIAPWNIALPGAVILLVIVSVNLVGDGLRSALDHRLH